VLKLQKLQWRYLDTLDSVASVERLSPFT